jgi:hypothetical protein
MLPRLVSRTESEITVLRTTSAASLPLTGGLSATAIRWVGIGTEAVLANG